MRSSFSSSIVALIISSLLICTLQVPTVSAQCQGCLDDVTHAVKGCSGLDLTKKQTSFKDYPAQYQQCMCNMGLDPTFFSNCQGQCPEEALSSLEEIYSSVYSMYCNGTSLANGGSAVAASTNAATSGLSTTASLKVLSSLVAMIVLLVSV